jgi:hypothetical protein
LGRREHKPYETKKDLSERDICSKFIGPAVKRAGWDGMMQIRVEVAFTKGRIIVRGKLVTQLLLDYKSWDAAKAKWYSEPWLGSIRESIHGTLSRWPIRTSNLSWHRSPNNS